MESTPGFRSFQTTYLVVYLINMGISFVSSSIDLPPPHFIIFILVLTLFICLGADWLQGPYIYALYEYYGFRKDQIAILFLCGFFSSMVFGTFVGSVADK